MLKFSLLWKRDGRFAGLYFQLTHQIFLPLFALHLPATQAECGCRNRKH